MKKFFKEMFSREPLNTGRQIEVDLAKALSIIWMIFIHAFEQLPNIEGSGGSGEYILMRVLNTIFAATIFMFCMGLGMGYTKKNDPNLIILRGLKIFIIGALLNFFRMCLSMIITNMVTPGTFSTEKILIELFQNDILFFAGLAMMLFGLLKKLRIPGWVVLIISVVMSILGTIFKGYDLHNVYGNTIVGWFIATDYPGTQFQTTSFFPLLNWFIFVAAGYCFAWVLKRVQKKGRFYIILGCISAICIGLYIGICVNPGYGLFKEDFRVTYHIATYDALIGICGSLFAFSLFYWLSFILPKFIKNGASMMSKHINTIYCIQWLIYGNLTNIYLVCAPDLRFKAWEVALYGFGILVFSVAAAWSYKDVIMKRIKKPQEAVS